MTDKPTRAGWKSIAETAKDAYWRARHQGKDENSALLVALDVAVALATDQDKP